MVGFLKIDRNEIFWAGRDGGEQMKVLCQSSVTPGLESSSGQCQPRVCDHDPLATAAAGSRILPTLEKNPHPWKN
ncbi:hypothetical protein TNCV_4249291 [Trichonephila clavipes]|nr:hypothetical protein TNCV_4249291 [Trichonephila clavipes]